MDASRPTGETPDAFRTPATPETLRDWIAHRAAVTPARTALVAGGRTWSFAALDAEASHAARRLFASGVRAGDRVATLLHNGSMPAILVHAVLRLGATLVPLNARLSPAEVAWQLGDAAPRILVAERRTRALLPPGASGRGPDVVDAATLAHAEADVAVADAPLREEHDPAHVLAIVYTSGTSGRPKGAMLTVSNFWWSAIGSALNLGVHADDRWLACLPLFHVGGLSIITRSAIYGTTAVVHESFDAAAVNAAIDRDGVTIVSVVAVMLQRMLDEREDRPYPQSLRCVLLGGGPAPRALLERCARLRILVVQTYGLTETASQVATLAPEDALRKLGSAGKALYPNELRIAAAAGDRPAPALEGEIQVRGPVVTAGYRGAPEATSRAMEDGWLRTGDIGRLDADGFLYVLDRRDDLVISGGENVYPAEVEAVLLAHSWVADAAVIGMPDPQWGQRVVAVVQLTTGADSASAGDALRAHCRARLASYKTPAEVRVITGALPRTASGKLRRGQLREMLGSGRAQGA